VQDGDWCGGEAVNLARLRGAILGCMVTLLVVVAVAVVKEMVR